MALRERIRLLLTVKGTPTELSLAFSIGVFIGMSPFLGLHTVLALAVASLFRLNKLVTLAGAYITNPWTILPIYTFGTWLGIKVMSHEEILQHIDLRGINVFNLVEFLGQLVVPFFCWHSFAWHNFRRDGILFCVHYFKTTQKGQR